MLKLREQVYEPFGWNHETIYRGANVIIESKDKKLAQDLLDMSDFYSKISTIVPMPEEYGKKMFLYWQAAKFRPVFIKVKDNFKDNDEMSEFIFDLLEERKRQYEQTGRPSIINVENLDKLLDKNSNSKSDIAVMKDILSNSRNYNHCIFTTATTPDKRKDFAAGINEPHRFGHVYNIDKAGVTHLGINLLTISEDVKNILEPAIYEAAEVYSSASAEYIKLADKIKQLQEECKKEISQIDESLCKKVNKNADNILDGAGNETNGLKKLIILGGAVLAGIFAAKKIFFNDKKRQNIQNTKQNTYNTLNYNTSSIFKNFVL